MIATNFESDLLGRPYTIQIMLILRKNFPMPLMEIQQRIKANRSAVDRRMKELSEAGMVKVETIKNAKQRVIVSLTPFGREVANQLLLINRLDAINDR